MLTETERIKADIAAQKTLIAQNDRQIEDAERRQALRRQHGAKLYNRLLQLEAQLERQDAQLVKPVGPCVTEIDYRGRHWDV